MGFRARNRNEYNRWRSQNLHALVMAGIPSDFVGDNRRFWFVVQEGCDLGQSGWNVDWITISRPRCCWI